MEELAHHPDVMAAARHYTQQQIQLAELIVQVQQIAAPTDAERARATWVARYFSQLGLADVLLDEHDNVYARIVGRQRGPALMVSAHTDTVFPADTDLTVRADGQNDRIYGPGIGDNSAGVASLLALAETLHSLAAPPVDIWLVANSGEEGLGDLRGMRAAVDRLQDRIGASIVIEGMGLKRVVHQALGSRRFRITIKAPGGHSWSDFGTASAIHVLTQLATDLTKLQPPERPRTTFNIGRFTGGTSINTIAQEASLELDLRSEEAASLNTLVGQVQEIVRRYQNASWQKRGVTVEAVVIGDRPGGELADHHPLVLAAFRSLAACGVKADGQLRISSTDANIPLSRGIPAVCIGITEGGNAHRMEEWITPKLLPTGMCHLLTLSWWTALWLAGEVK